MVVWARYGPDDQEIEWDCESCQECVDDLPAARNCSLPEYEGTGNIYFIREYTESLYTKECPIGLTNEAFDSFIQLFWFTHSVVYANSMVSIQCHSLPVDGGLLDQPHILIQAVDIVRREMNAIGLERIKRAKVDKK